jgi:signal transduction histidine kinase
MFSAFGSSGNSQLNNPAAAPIRRAVAVQSRRATGFTTDSESPFNRPFIVPERLFGGAEREAAPSLRWRGANLATWEFFAENWPPEDRILSPLPPSGTAPLRGPSPSTRAQQEQRGESGQWRVRFAPWFVETGVPALLRPKLSYIRQGTGLRSMSSGDWIVIELNRKVLQERLFPELVERSFSGHEGLIYDIAVKAVARNELIYSSASGFGRDSGESADAQLGIFGSSGGPSGPMRVFFAEARGPQTVPAGDGPRWARRHMGPALIPLQATDGWELLARHRKGSLEAAVAALRRRNLGISFGVLLVLGVTMAMVMVTARRAQRLATLQMDFVAGVSHELRTPLAVISSAADNIADGIVSDKTRLARYGKLIRDHSRQLTDLVEQILSFAASRQQNQNYNLVRVPPSEFIEAALRNSAETIRNAGFTLEQEIEAGLPEVAVDVSVAARCLQNLVSNAVKYGGEQRWVGVRARAVKGGIRISVEDRGIGIEAQELEHIFDPFYRAPGVVAAQIHGTGLGLALARSMAESLGGRLTATSKPGQGSTFVLELPAAAPQNAESV